MVLDEAASGRSGRCLFIFWVPSQPQSFCFGWAVNPSTPRLSIEIVLNTIKALSEASREIRITTDDDVAVGIDQAIGAVVIGPGFCTWIVESEVLPVGFSSESGGGNTLRFWRISRRRDSISEGLREAVLIKKAFCFYSC
jgi:hypothetical protein